MISTAPVDRSEGIFLKEYEIFCKVRDGEVKDNSLLPVLFTFPVERDDLDINNPDEWWRGCPGLGVTQSKEALVAEYEQAKLHGTPEDMSLFLSQRLNIMPVDRQASTSWSVAAIWPTLPVKQLSEVGKLFRPSVAIDAGGSVDFFSVTLSGFLGEDDDAPLYTTTKQYVLRAHYERFRPGLKPVLDRAVAEGELILCSTTVDIEAKICDQIAKWLAGYEGFALVGGDKWGVSGIAERIERYLLRKTDYPYVFQDVKSNASLGAAGNLLESLAHDGRIIHDGSGLMLWNLQNVVKTTDNRGYTRFEKQDEFGTGGERFLKIDGVISLVSSCYLLYEEREFNAEVEDWVC